MLSRLSGLGEKCEILPTESPWPDESLGVGESSTYASEAPPGMSNPPKNRWECTPLHHCVRTSAFRPHGKSSFLSQQVGNVSALSLLATVSTVAHGDRFCTPYARKRLFRCWGCVRFPFECVVNGISCSILAKHWRFMPICIKDHFAADRVFKWNISRYITF